jgi:hypothetical protein
MLPKAGEAQVTITLPGFGHSVAPLGTCYIEVADALKFSCTLDPDGVWSFNDGVHVLGAEGGCLVMPGHDSIIYNDLTKTLNIDASEDLYLWGGCVVSIKRFAPSLCPILDDFRLDATWHLPHGGMIWKGFRLPSGATHTFMYVGPGGMTMAKALKLTRATLIPGLAPPGVPGGQNVPGGIFFANGLLVPADTSLAGGTRIDPHTAHFPHNTSIPGGTILPKGFRIPAGSRFPRGTSFPPMWCFSSTPNKFFPGGTHWPDGRKLLDDNDSDVEASGVLAHDSAMARANEGAADDSKVAKGDTEALVMDVPIVGLQRDSKDKGEKGKKLDDEVKGLDDKYGKPGGEVRKLDVEDDKTNLHAELARLRQEARIKDEKIKQLDTEKKKADQAAQKREDELRQDARIKDEAARKREDELQKEVRTKDDMIRRLDTERDKANQAAQKREDELRQEARTKDDKIKQLETEREKASREVQEFAEMFQQLEDKIRTSAHNEVAKDHPVAASPTNDSHGSGSGDKAGGDDGDGDDEAALFRFPGDRDREGDGGGQISVTVRVVQNRRSRSNQRSQGRAGRRR